jgi:hypothetical protein
MFFYLIHSLPHSADLNEKKRNVRTIFIGGMLYLFFHAVLFNKYFGTKLKYLSLLKPYFFYVLGADILTMNMLYKISTGKWLISELDFNYSKEEKKHTEIQQPINNQPLEQYVPCVEIPEYIPNDPHHDALSKTSQEVHDAQSKQSQSAQDPIDTKQKSNKKESRRKSKKESKKKSDKEPNKEFKKKSAKESIKKLPKKDEI